MCYTCQHYRMQTEKVARRGSKKTKRVDVQVERCAARLNAQLRVPVVNGTLGGLVTRDEFEQMVKEAEEKGLPPPFVFGSEQRYYDEAGALVECQLYQRKESDGGNRISKPR